MELGMSLDDGNIEGCRLGFEEGIMLGLSLGILVGTILGTCEG